MIQFKRFEKIPRLSRQMVVTEKIDGVNSQVHIIRYKDFIETLLFEGMDVEHWTNFRRREGVITIHDHLIILAGSRDKYLSKFEDCYGFWEWVNTHKDELVKLGPGRHFGEWWGKGIGRQYGLQDQRFSLFNVDRWTEKDEPVVRSEGSEGIIYKDKIPTCCSLVPVLYEGIFDTGMVDLTLSGLIMHGSAAAPGFHNPEGVVVYHKAGDLLFKKTLRDVNKTKEGI